MSAARIFRFLTRHPLNQKDRIGALLRFAKWQIGSRLVPGDVLFEWINGAKLVVSPGETVATGNIYAGLQEFADMAYVIHVLRKDDLFVDVGANIGSYTVLAGAVAGANGVSFEPAPSTFEKLMINVRANQLDDKVQCLNIGLGAQPGTIAFTSDQDAINHVLTENEATEHAIQVEVSTLDTVLANQSPHVIKIDVEGYETSVLEGAEKTLKKESLHSVLIELKGYGKRYGFDESKIYEMMAELGFEMFSYDPLNRSLLNLQGKKPESGNALFIRNHEVASQAVADSKEFEVHGQRF